MIKNITKLNSRWLAFYLVCLGDLMIILDTTIVNVALPSIRNDLKFTESSLAWVVNAFLLTNGGFLLLGGRLGDLYGHRKLFVMGTILFTLASLTCGFASSQEMLIVGRALQGIGGAVVSSLALSLMMNLFTETEERTKAMGIFGFVGAGGGSLGLLIGGLLTGSFNWHWIFLVNIPIGIVVVILSFVLLPAAKPVATSERLDLLGAFAITASLMLAVYAIVNGNRMGWDSLKILGLLSTAIALLLGFLYWETKVAHPLMPLRLFRNRNLSITNIIGVLWAASMFAWFFLSALYLQLVLNYTPLQIGLSFLPANIIMAAFSLGLSAKVTLKFGVSRAIAVGLFLISLGLLLFVRAPVDGKFWMDVFPNMILLGLGSGIAFNPVLFSAMDGVPQEEAGLASGLVNTSFMMGGALGLASLASLAGSRSTTLLAAGASQAEALLGGYHLAFLVGSLFSAVAALMGLVLIRPK